MLPYLAILLYLNVYVNGDTSACSDRKMKNLLRQHKVNGEITPLLKGHTYVDIWRRKVTTENIDCSMVAFTEIIEGVAACIHNVDHTGKPIQYNHKWNENLGESSFHYTGELQAPGEETEIFDFNLHVFHVDEFVLGFYSCDRISGFIRVAITVRKDKMNDQKALESIERAEITMNKLKDIIPEEMAKLERTKCPEKEPVC